MTPAQIWRRRFLLVVLVLCSAIPPFLHYRMLDAPLDNVRFAGGLHPSEILELRQFGRLTAYVPLLFVLALLLSAFRPHSTSTVLAIGTAIFIASLLVHLFIAFIVIILRI